MAALGDERDAAPGIARALIGLGEPAAAARLLSPLASSSRFPGPLLELLITADEAAHDFGPAVTAAQRLGQLGSASYPDGDSLIPMPVAGSVGSDPLDEGWLPLSFGADRLTPLTVNLLGPSSGGGEAGIGAGPVVHPRVPRRFRSHGKPAELPVVDLDSGRAAPRARRLGAGELATEFLSVLPGSELRSDGRAEVDSRGGGWTAAQSEHHENRRPHQRRHRRRLAEPAALGGKSPRREEVRRAVASSQGSNGGLPAFRLGEIYFLMHQYNDAAAEFGLAARRLFLVSYNDDLDVDQAELDRGAALLASPTSEAVRRSVRSTCWEHRATRSRLCR